MGPRYSYAQVVKRFYNPDLSPDEVEALDWANFLLVQTAQAFLGTIGDNFQAIAVEPSPDAAVVHVALEQPSPADEEEIADAVAELDVLLGGRARLSLSVTYGRPDFREWSPPSKRLLFLKRVV